ncbi:MAG: DUF3558 family protein [Rhodococcus sp.]|nr:DUF3558 family protein [Rhodococcus sp. (in: high G+C Gram-positive bacteria)]
MTRTRFTAAAMAAVAASVIAGCGDGTSAPAATTTPSEPIAISYHPCHDLPRDVIDELGFSPRNWTPNERTAPFVSNECSTVHIGPDYGAGFAASGETFQKVLDNKNLEEFKRTTIDGRDVYFANHQGISCYGTVDIEPGVFQFTVMMSRLADKDDPNEITSIEQACAEAERILTAVLPYVPDQL